MKPPWSRLGHPARARLIFDEVGYYGDGRIVVPFLVTAKYKISYEIYKRDWYATGYEEYECIPATDLNKDYALVEDYRDVDIKRTIDPRPTNQ